jgi:superfamily I DNA and RNA helicase
VRQAGVAASILANLEMTPFRLRFTGSAGSGKSLLAWHFYAREAAEGKRVLLTCFNRPLATRLRARLPAQGRVDTFHGFCVEFLKSRGQPPDFERSGADPEFWRRVPELVTAQHIPEDWLFDALVVDEGQDFEQEWLDILTLFLREGSDILWLEDPDQNLQGRPPVATAGFVGYRCPLNYRSPESIARFIRNTLPFEFDVGNDLPGMGVGIHEYTDPAEQPKVVTRLVQDLLRLGFTYADIVVLTCRGVRSSVFSALDEVGGVSLRRVTREYDPAGNQVFIEGRLIFDSVRRFKGQEAPAIILVDVDPRPDRLAEEERVLYCGMTRATVRLDMVVQADNPENRRFWQHSRREGMT